VAAVKATGSESFARDFVKSMFTSAAESRVPDAVQKIIFIISHTSPLAIAGTQLALASRTDTTSSLSELKLPVLILVGEQDPVTPVSAAEAMRARIPGAEFAVVPNASHLSNMENPGYFNERLVRFLDGVRSRQ
jgi:pimeloyl-ACP methyl ester carboxylesterase